MVFVCYISDSFNDCSCCADSGMIFKFISALMNHYRRPTDSSGAVGFRLTQVHQCVWYIYDLSKVNEFWRVRLSLTCLPLLLPLGWGTLWAPGSQSASTSSAVSSPPPSAHLRQLSPFQTQLIWTPGNVYRLAKIYELCKMFTHFKLVFRVSLDIHLTSSCCYKTTNPLVDGIDCKRGKSSQKQEVKKEREFTAESQIAHYFLS